MTRSRNILPPRRHWQDWECKLLEQHYAASLTEALASVLGRPVYSVHRKASKMGLHKTKEFIAAVARERCLAPGHGSKATQFQKGIVPANKGLRRPGWAVGHMRATQFKPGNRPHTWVPVGSHRINAEGVLQVKLNDLPGPSAVRWFDVHRLLWVAQHGEVPAGHVLAFKPGRRTTDLALLTADAVECITRAQLQARNSIHNLPGPLKEVVRLRASLSRQIHKRETEEP